MAEKDAASPAEAERLAAIGALELSELGAMFDRVARLARAYSKLEADVVLVGAERTWRASAGGGECGEGGSTCASDGGKTPVDGSGELGKPRPVGCMYCINTRRSECRVRIAVALRSPEARASRVAIVCRNPWVVKR